MRPYGLQTHSRTHIRSPHTTGLTHLGALKSPPLNLLAMAGGHSARATLVPIPNTTVKPRSADGTARETVWESRSSPTVLFCVFPHDRLFCLLSSTSALNVLPLNSSIVYVIRFGVGGQESERSQYNHAENT